jgi:FKBP-type peptidyl-prolyl cis-trans isomerase FklB
MKYFIAFTTLLVGGMYAQAQEKKNTPKTKPAAAPVAKPASSSLKNNLDSFSYAVGLNIAGSLKQQSIENINTAAMAKAIDDVLKNKATLLNDQQAMQLIQGTMMAAKGKKAEGEKAKGRAFLAKNKLRKEVITLPSGLQYEVLKKGDPNSPMPTLQDTIVAHYAGKTIDGKENFDASYDRGQPLTIGVTSVIKGWTEILQLMHIGDKFKVYIPSELGYGDGGAGAGIPGGATLIFDMELLDIKKPANSK